MSLQYVLYNIILRESPQNMFQDFRRCAGDNLFSTTIFVLASAVQKISRVMKLPDGLILYRGLGGTTDLPDSFFKKDENSCHGFVEWGFMSTTATKQVAIDYSGINSKKPLPLLLSFKVGAADRGACIKDFSRYPEEVEYLFAPCSFMQKDGIEMLEVTAAGVVLIFPVKVNVNLKTQTIEELVAKKKNLHLASFRYRIDEIKKQLNIMAEKKDAHGRLARDITKKEHHSVQGFLDTIVQ
jgi:hypothetical protein